MYVVKKPSKIQLIADTVLVLTIKVMDGPTAVCCLVKYLMNSLFCPDAH